MWIYIHPFCQALLIWKPMSFSCGLFLDNSLDNGLPSVFPFLNLYCLYVGSLWQVLCFSCIFPLIFISFISLFSLSNYSVFIFQSIFTSAISDFQEFLLHSKYYFIEFCFMDAIASLVFLKILIIVFEIVFLLKSLQAFFFFFFFLLCVSVSNFHFRFFLNSLFV